MAQDRRAAQYADGEYSVCQFFQNGSYEYVRRFVAAQEAVMAFRHYTMSVGAKLGTTVRVIITDGGDCCNMEWVRGKGIVYPPPTRREDVKV